MLLCKTCGVELDEGLDHCPLCGRSVHDDKKTLNAPLPASIFNKKTTAAGELYLLQRITWQVTAVLLLSGIIATLIIDAWVHKRITWSVFPISVCTILLSYAAVLALIRTGLVLQLIIGWIISTGVLIGFHYIFQDTGWMLRLAIPILFITNLMTMVLIFLMRSVGTKGLNVFAFSLFMIAIYCICLEGLISLYTRNQFFIQWSIIVTACLLPVTASLLFIHFRIKRNKHLEKIFHT
ncbi:hypothetical protein [Chryseolinea sp. H1M3-3]|uniref:hypothetical protein n=1 Tax=Chryseolinea sp. H1M3-3 TaxID=3034144 RepID=UPI0023ED69FA|nr:hypothetical protein [Chryseolinea sp. H1M3-3]